LAVVLMTAKGQKKRVFRLQFSNQGI